MRAVSVFTNAKHPIDGHKGTLYISNDKVKTEMEEQIKYTVRLGSTNFQALGDTPG